MSLDRHSDDRGYLSELLSPQLQSSLGVDEFQQLNFSSSKSSVFRGMHLQTPPHGQDKLIFCLSGSLMDFVLDVGPTSDTFGQSISVELCGETPHALFVPGNYAHGFLSGNQGAQVLYATSKPRSVEHEISINYKSTSVASLLTAVPPIISARDAEALDFGEFLSSQFGEGPIR